MSIDKRIDYEIQGGVKNFRPSEMVTVPKIAKSSPNTPTAKLAYITPKEEDMFIKSSPMESISLDPLKLFVFLVFKLKPIILLYYVKLTFDQIFHLLILM